MLMCSAPVYHDVIDEWKHAGRPGRRKKKEKKLGELPSYMRGSDGPDKSRSEDLSAYLSGKGAVYGAPDWQAEWNSARFLPELQDSHGSQVLLPFVKSSERKRKAKAADISRAAMLSKSLDQSVVQPSARSGETGDASASKRPPSATAQSILEKERAHNSRPHSAKSVNENVLLVREKHTIGREIAKKEGTSRPQSREGLGASSRGPGGPSSRPPSQNDDARPPSQSRLTGASGTRDLVGGGADTAASAKSGTKSDPTGSAPSAPAKTGTSRDLTAASPLAKSGTKRDLIQVSTAGSAPMARSGTKKDLAAGASERRGGRGKRGSAAAEALSPAGAGGGGVDNAVVEAMQAELDAYKAAEARLKERLKEKDAQIHELTHKVFYLNDELNGATDKQGKMQAEVERARESNARFDDVKQLLQLAENERVKLMDEVEKLQEDNLTWRPIQQKLEARIETLLLDVAQQATELDRLRHVENELRVEKDKVAAATIQVQSWQDISADLQAKCERWEQVNESTALALRQARADATQLTLERREAEAKVDKYAELLEVHDIPLPDDAEAEHAVSEDDDDDEASAEPLTSLRTTALLKGQLPEDTVPRDDTTQVGHDIYEEEPAFGTHERQA